jgi:predicted AAA+ superfamily ATPase
VEPLSPWHENVKKRQVKSPKIYIRDAGIFHFLQGIRRAAELQAHPKLGAPWEGFAMEQVLVGCDDGDAYSWSDL